MRPIHDAIARRRTARIVAAALAALALAAPAAMARPVIDPPARASSPAGAPALDATAQPRPVTVKATHDGFDWGSAGIGAAAAGGLILVGAGGLGASYRSRMRVMR